MISSSSPSSSSLPPGGSFAIFAVNTALLVAYHVAYTNKNDDDDNIHTNSAHLSLLDKILFGGLVLMAFELLDFITKHSGSE